MRSRAPRPPRGSRLWVLGRRERVEEFALEELLAKLVSYGLRCGVAAVEELKAGTSDVLKVPQLRVGVEEAGNDSYRAFVAGVLGCTLGDVIGLRELAVGCLDGREREVEPCGALDALDS